MNFTFIFNTYYFHLLQMAASQSRADLAEKKKKLMLSKIKDVWQSQLSIVFEDAWKVSPMAIDIALKGLEWEEEYTVARRGTDVRLIAIKNDKNYTYTNKLPSKRHKIKL